MVRLLADSSYLKEAGLNWKKYYAAIGEEINACRYSQHAAAFLLTLLPNVKMLKLPKYWKPVDATDKLIDVVIHRARQAHLPYDRSSIAQVTRFVPSVSSGPQARFNLDWVTSFLALPHLQFFRGSDCVAISDGLGSIMSRCPHRGFKALKAVHLVSSFIYEVAITDFLKHTPRLKTLTYSHSTKENCSPQDWDICRFITAIEREVGSHLAELSISIPELRGSIAPGKASMRGFQQLQKLEFPLEIAMRNLTAATSTDHELDYSELFIGGLVPASVSQLSLISGGTDQHEKALEVMFRNFATKKGSEMPALKEIYLSCFVNADDAYKEQCVKLAAETKKVGVVLRLREWQDWFPWT